MCRRPERSRREHAGPLSSQWPSFTVVYTLFVHSAHGFRHALCYGENGGMRANQYRSLLAVGSG
jgi:hypothetical protein